LCRILLLVGVYAMAGIYVNVNKFHFLFSVLCSIYVVCNNVLCSGIGLELCTAIEVFSHTDHLKARLGNVYPCVTGHPACWDAINNPQHNKYKDRLEAYKLSG
jgi:hypothetical protein